VSASAAQDTKGLFGRLFAAYAAGDRQVLERAPAMSLIRIRYQDVDAAIARWRKDRQPVQAVFLLELARWRGVELLDKARAFVTERPDPPGRNVADDAFEVAWHKTAVSLLEGYREPATLDVHGVAALGLRMTAARQTPRDQRLVDPWVELTFGIAEEQWTITVPTSLTKRGPSAIQHFDEAAKFEATRAEALVRKASLLVRLHRPAEALTTLDTLRTDDGTLRYWSLLFLGRALELLGRPDDAVRDYTEALTLVPRAQSPAVALTSLEMRRGRHDEAVRWAAAGRAPFGATDPWWEYDLGEHRLFKVRLDALRAMVKP
jgi:tetratricopeptide (TPR) repeat protein